MSSEIKSGSATLPGAETETDDGRDGRDACPSDQRERMPHLRAWVQYSFYIAIALFAVLKDPFHWTEASANLSQDIFYRVFIGPFYPTERRNDITVVLFNETTLKELAATWPVQLGTHADVLRTIRGMGPSAVLVDFIFPDQRFDPSVSELRDEIEEYRKADIPLYFGRAEGAAVDWIRSDLADHATLTSITKPINDGVSRTYDPCTLSSADVPVCACITGMNTFEDCPPEVDATSDDSRVALTAAFQLYRSYTKTLPRDFSVHQPIPMDVVWSNRLNPVNQDWMGKTTDAGLEGLCLKIGPDFLDLVLRSFSESQDLSLRQTCPYTTTVPAHSVLEAQENRKLFNALWVHLQRKIVLYGADLAGLEDTVLPPTQIKLPGVYLHAMALDNLLTFQGEYKRSSISHNGAHVHPKYAEATVAVVLAFIVVAFARSARVQRAKNIPIGDAQGFAYLAILGRRQTPWSVFNGVMFLAIMGVCLTLYFRFGLSPKNWLGYWSLLTFLSIQGPSTEKLVTAVGKHVWPSSGKYIFKEKRT